MNANDDSNTVPQLVSPETREVVWVATLHFSAATMALPGLALLTLYFMTDGFLTDAPTFYLTVVDPALQRVESGVLSVIVSGWYALPALLSAILARPSGAHRFSSLWRWAFLGILFATVLEAIISLTYIKGATPAVMAEWANQVGSNELIPSLLSRTEVAYQLALSYLALLFGLGGFKAGPSPVVSARGA